MEILYERCCGLDVHKKVIVACLLLQTKEASVQKEIRSFGTTWRDLVQLQTWLEQAGCTHIAMESTGVYWRPVFNVLEEHFAQVMVVNAAHLKAVPGKKTDVKDAQWIAELLSCGLLRPSFIPPRPQRELRELTRGRKQLIEQQSRLANRVQKVLEDTNIKLASVVSDILGKSARQMLWALLEGETDLDKIAGMGRGRLRDKQPALRQALEGQLRPHHQFLLRELLIQVEEVQRHIDAFDREIESRLGLDPDPDSGQPNEPESAPAAREEEEQDPQSSASAEQMADTQAVSPEAQSELAGYGDLVRLWDTVTGIGARTAQVLVAELGIEMGRFVNEHHLASWVGLCPGNRVSAGKRLGGKIAKGNVYVRAVLIEAARAAARSQGTYLAAWYQRQKARLGGKRALVALAHRMLIILYHMATKGQPYQEYGEHVVQERVLVARKQRAIRQLECLGYQVALQQAESA